MKTFLKLILVAMLVAAFAVTTRTNLRAQQTFTADDAIAFVSSLPAFAQGLQTTEGWRVEAYNTMNRYGIWRVTFWNAEGDQIGMADVNLEQARVYTSEAYFYPSESVIQDSQQTIFDFVRNRAEVQDLLDNAWEANMYLDWNPWVMDGVWSVWIENGNDPLYVWVEPDNSSTFSVSNLEFRRVGFGNIMEWEDWRSANESNAAAIGFNQGEIANRLRDLSGWTSHAEPIDGGANGIWWVGFYSGDFLAAEATVDVTNNEILTYTTY